VFPSNIHDQLENSQGKLLMMNHSILPEKTSSSTHEKQAAILIAWTGMLLLSRLPQVIAQEFLRIDLGHWWLWIWVAAGVVLMAATFLWQVIRPLRTFFGVLTVVYALTLLLNRVVETAVWQSWFGGVETAWAIRFFGERLVAVLLALGVVIVLLLTGQSRRDLFLVKGNWFAPTGLRLPGRTTPVTWAALGPAIAVGLTLLIGGGAVALSSPAFLDWQQLIWLFPAVVFFALMNAFAEEVAYRAAPLSQLVPVVGETQAVWVTAVWFGLGHYYGGIPSGPVGAIFLAFVALLFGRAMLATKGITMPIFIHLFGDIVVYSLLAITS
jgi:membrane protease YdiL (CAAX protease family)